MAESPEHTSNRMATHDTPTSSFRTGTFTVNGEENITAYPVHHTLLEVLRERLNLTGTKHGCELGECGTCTVLIDNRPVLSCLVLAADAEDKPIETVEGLQHGNQLHPLQVTFADLGAAQCGYCTPGLLMAAKQLLDVAPDPTRDQVSEALGGNLCRCTGYIKIVEAVEAAARIQRGEDWQIGGEAVFGFPEPGFPEPRTPEPGPVEPASPKPSSPQASPESEDSGEGR